MRVKTAQRLMVLALLLAAGVGRAAGQQQGGAPAPPPSQFKVMTSAYSEGGRIPTQYSCADQNATTAAYQWSNPPAGTASFAVILHDTDAAPAKGAMDVTHWILWNVPATSTQLAGGVAVGASPDGIQQGKNVRGVNGYQPPCPPPGGPAHHYIFELYALDKKLDLAAGASRAELLAAMDGHVIGKASYVGLFGR